MKVAIVGSEGFLGRYLVRSWKSKQNELVIFNRKNSFLDKYGNLVDSFKACEVVIWAATSVNPIIAETQAEIVSKEISDWRHLLEKISQSVPFQRIVLLSSGGCVYSGDDLPFKENSEAFGINKYGQFKIQQEQMLTESLQNTTIVRLSNVYGEGQPHGRGQGVISEWTHAAKKGNPLKIFGNLQNSRDYLHVLDAASAIESLIMNKSIGCFNVGSGAPTRLVEILDVFKKLSRDVIQVQTFPQRSIDRNEYYLSIEKIKKQISWLPQIKIDQGIAGIMNSQT
jgi:UDP-glucose 4-epimerase